MRSLRADPDSAIGQTIIEGGWLRHAVVSRALVDGQRRTARDGRARSIWWRQQTGDAAYDNDPDPAWYYMSSESACAHAGPPPGAYKEVARLTKNEGGGCDVQWLPLVEPASGGGETPMTQMIYAVEITLTKITPGTSLPDGCPPDRLVKLSHYDGSHTEAEARALYDACNAVFEAHR